MTTTTQTISKELTFPQSDTRIILEDYVCAVCHAELAIQEIENDERVFIICPEHGNVCICGRVMRSSASMQHELSFREYYSIVAAMPDLYGEIWKQGIPLEQARRISSDSVCALCGDSLIMQAIFNSQTKRIESDLVNLICRGGHGNIGLNGIGITSKKNYAFIPPIVYRRITRLRTGFAEATPRHFDHMRATTAEVQNSQRAANKLFANGGKPTGFLMIDGQINKQQRLDLQKSFVEMVSGSTARLSILEANMKFNQVNLTPEDMQLLSTRSFSVQEIGRWFGIPAILLNQTEGTSTLGSSSSDIIDNFYKLTVRPAIVSIEQAIRKRVMTPRQRATMSVEFNMDGLLRASLFDRMEIYSKAVQNGIKSRNECRQLENDPPFVGGDIYTAQSNLLPIDMIGKTTPTGGAGGNQANIAQ